jgi:hypothetical protein
MPYLLNEYPYYVVYVQSLSGGFTRPFHAAAHARTTDLPQGHVTLSFPFPSRPVRLLSHHALVGAMLATRAVEHSDPA